MYNECRYTRMWKKEPPRFKEDILYMLPAESRHDQDVTRTGAELNTIQQTVIYDMTTRWRPVGVQIQTREVTQ